MKCQRCDKEATFFILKLDLSVCTSCLKPKQEEFELHAKKVQTKKRLKRGGGNIL